jgi:hypothetical protein
VWELDVLGPLALPAPSPASRQPEPRRRRAEKEQGGRLRDRVDCYVVQIKLPASVRDTEPEHERRVSLVARRL